MQQNVALQVARKVELSSTFRNVARQVAACNMSTQLAMLFFRHRCVASCTKNFACVNMAFSFSTSCPRQIGERAIYGHVTSLMYPPPRLTCVVIGQSMRKTNIKLVKCQKLSLETSSNSQSKVEF